MMRNLFFGCFLSCQLWMNNMAVAFAPGSIHSHSNSNSIRNSNSNSISHPRAFVALSHVLSLASSTSSSDVSAVEALEGKVKTLKRVLEREYVTFFDPMRREYYSPEVTFEDPMTSLDSVDAYQYNVDMLASRTLLGQLLFSDAGIALHNITGGHVNADGSISDIQTRWTLRLTAKVLPWKPTARFSGISVYKVVPSSDQVGVQIVGQVDYWDSINIRPDSGGQYQKVPKGTALSDFFNQLKPGGFQAKTAAPELPYQLLRRGDGYEVRKYPSFVGVKLPYKRRDEGFGSLGAFTRGMDPLSPALMEVQNQDTTDKYMLWPLTFTQPGQDQPRLPIQAKEKAGTGQWRTIQLQTLPERVVAVTEFTDASMEPVVRKADRELRASLARDGLTPISGSEDLVRFAQYDAIFSMGKRRGEVWIDLDTNGHPW